MSIEAEDLFKKATMPPMTYETAIDILSGKKVIVKKEGGGSTTINSVARVGGPTSTAAIQGGMLFELFGAKQAEDRYIDRPSVIVNRRDEVQIE